MSGERVSGTADVVSEAGVLIAVRPGGVGGVSDFDAVTALSRRLRVGGMEDLLSEARRHIAGERGAAQNCDAEANHSTCHHIIDN